MKAYFYSATGNLLWLIEHPDLTQANFMQYAEIAERLCAQQYADGLMLMNSVTLELWIINADGSNGSFCGNGICAAAYHLQTTRHLKTARLTMAGQMVDADMTVNAITIAFAEIEDPVQTRLLDQAVTAYAIQVPNPHLVIINPPAEWTLAQEGKRLCLQYNSNVEFVYPENAYFRVEVYERGVGITAACGSGAIAVFKVLQSLSHVKTEIAIKMSGGDLTIRTTEGRLYLSEKVRLLKSEEIKCI